VVEDPPRGRWVRPSRGHPGHRSGSRRITGLVLGPWPGRHLRDGVAAAAGLAVSGPAGAAPRRGAERSSSKRPTAGNAHRHALAAGDPGPRPASSQHRPSRAHCQTPPPGAAAARTSAGLSVLGTFQLKVPGEIIAKRPDGARQPSATYRPSTRTPVTTGELLTPCGDVPPSGQRPSACKQPPNPQTAANRHRDPRIRRPVPASATT